MNIKLTLCCIKELMNHVIEQSTLIYCDTIYKDNFIIFNDGLSAWWEKESQEYLEQQEFARRQLCCRDPTNIDNRYRNKLTGDSPEICVSLDSHGFADLMLEDNRIVEDIEISYGSS